MWSDKRNKMSLRGYVQWLMITVDGFFEAMTNIRAGHERTRKRMRTELGRAVESRVVHQVGRLVREPSDAKRGHHQSALLQIVSMSSRIVVEIGGRINGERNDLVVVTRVCGVGWVEVLPKMV
jgi:hypothetical protein